MKKNIQRVGCGCGDRPPSGPSILRFGGLVEKRKTHKTPDESFNQGIFVVSVLVQTSGKPNQTTKSKSKKANNLPPQKNDDATNDVLINFSSNLFLFSNSPPFPPVELLF
jgi:hypothetical protein